MSTVQRESVFQSKLKKEIERTLGECLVFKMEQRQGLPDLLVLYKDRWAFLECKRSKTASKRPNQEYYVSKLDKMSFARFIYPENKKEVLDELYQALRFKRKTRVPKRK